MSTMKTSQYLVIHRQANARCKAITFHFTKYLTLFSPEELIIAKRECRLGQKVWK